MTASLRHRSGLRLAHHQRLLSARDRYAVVKACVFLACAVVFGVLAWMAA